MKNSEMSKRVVTSKFPRLVPIEFSDVTDTVDNGHGGTQPLPVSRSPAFQFPPEVGAWTTHTAWVVPKRHHQKFNDKLAVSVVVVTDKTGKVLEMSVVIPEVQLTEG